LLAIVGKEGICGLPDFIYEHPDYTEDTVWADLCSLNDIYNIYTAEFIDGLAKEIALLNASPIVEIAAGEGLLSC
jgi:hypothetical protein